MSEDEYKVGYKNPPKQYQFQKGRSGNSRGSAGTRLDPGEILLKELAVKVTVTENGRTEKISKEVAMARRLVRNAAAGKWREVTEVLSYLPKDETTVKVIGFDHRGNRIN